MSSPPSPLRLFFSLTLFGVCVADIAAQSQVNMMADKICGSSESYALADVLSVNLIRSFLGTDLHPRDGKISEKGRLYEAELGEVYCREDSGWMKAHVVVTFPGSKPRPARGEL